MGRAIGIDLGTTNSCSAAIVDGNPIVILNEDGTRTIPSVFAIDREGNNIVGAAAAAQEAGNVDNTVVASKRLLGRDFDSKAVDKYHQVFTYDLQEGDSSDVLVKVSDKLLTLEQIAAEILRKIKNNASLFLGVKVDQAVITVPAYFNDRQRHAVREAGGLAGLEVLRVLNEPTAAALAYGFGKNLDERVAVYDLGGGTFDISLIDIKGRSFEVIATGGDTFLGGIDFDDKLMQHLMVECVDDLGIDLSYDREAVAILRSAAEAAKIRLSTEEETTIRVEQLKLEETGEIVDLEFIVTRELLEDLTSELVERTISSCTRILNEAAIEVDNIDKFLVVGGQSRMPLVRQEVTSFCNKNLSDEVDADEAVAIGAAIMADALVDDSDTEPVELRDVLPSAIGVSGAKGQMHVLFVKNLPLPATTSVVLTTHKDDQKSIKLKIYQGESKQTEHNDLLGSFVFSGLREAPKGTVRIEVIFDIDAQALLSITAEDKDAGTKVEAKIAINEVSDKKRKKKKRRRKKAKKRQLRRSQSHRENPNAAKTSLKKGPEAHPASSEATTADAEATKKLDTQPDVDKSKAVRGNISRSSLISRRGQQKGVFGRLLSWFLGFLPWRR